MGLDGYFPLTAQCVKELQKLSMRKMVKYPKEGLNKERQEEEKRGKKRKMGKKGTSVVLVVMKSL